MELDLKKLKNKKICVAVSGGVDSMVLLHILKKKEKEFGYVLSAVNFEHGIRGEESVKDSMFVEKMCREWQVPLFSFRENCVDRSIRDKESLETAARAFRFEHYQKLLTEGKADCIATAHHANDEAETVLFRICRGASLTGASGIRETERIIRPLLGVSKEEIVEYAEREFIPYREDKTNFEKIATRNSIRLDVLPTLEQLIPGAVKNLVRFSSIAAEDDEFLYELSNELIAKTENKEKLVRFCDKKSLFRRACLTVMKQMEIRKDYSYTHLEDLFTLQRLKIGAKLTLPCGIEAKKTGDGILFYKRKESFEKTEIQEISFKLGTFLFGDYEISLSEAQPKEYDGRALKFDLDKLPVDCVIRGRREGDIFRKYGGGTKTLKRYLIDKKIPQEERDMPLIAEKNGNKVYAIFGVEISEDVKIENKSKTVYMTVKKYRR